MPGLPTPLRAHLWIVALVAALAAIAWDTHTRLQHEAHIVALASRLTPPPTEDPVSPTGYEFGQRGLILRDAGVDGYHWVMQAQQMFADGTPFVRHVDYDNAPEGREVHWAGLFRWWLGAIAWADSAVTGRPIGLAIERAAVIASPLLLALALPVLGFIVARCLGSDAAALVVLAFVGGRACHLHFLAGNPDHHGIAILAAFVCVFGVVAGGAGAVGRHPTPNPHAPTDAIAPAEQSAQRWFAASAVAGGIGLWNSASTQIQVLAGIGFGAVVAMVLLRRPPAGANWSLEPTLWRRWGAWGAGTSLLAYAIEYLPGHAGMRLEVNHPLHALAWLGAGEVLCRTGRILIPGTSAGRECRAALAAAALVALPPLAVALGGRDVFVVLDRFYTLLSVGYTSEGRSVVSHLQSGSLVHALLVMGLPVLAAVPPAIALFRRDIAPERRARLAVALAPALVLCAWGAAEIRWLGIAVGVLPIAWMHGLAPNAPAWFRRAALAAALTLVPGFFVIAVRSPEGFTRPELYRIVERDIAHWLRRRTGAAPLVTAAGPGRTTSFVFFGGARGLGTFYWENRAGIESAAALFRAVDEAGVQALVARHGITHIVLPGWDRFEQVVHSLDVRLAPGAAATEPFLNRIARTKVMPHWLRPLPYPLPRHELLAGGSVLVLEVDDAAVPADAPNHLARLLLETSQAGSALRLRPALERDPAHLPSLITLARAELEGGRTDDADATIRRIVREMGTEGVWTAEDHLRLAVVFAQARRSDAARTELERGLGALDERSLRRLTPATLAETLALADAFKVSLPNPRLAALARTLAPRATPPAK